MSGWTKIPNDKHEVLAAGCRIIIAAMMHKQGIEHLIVDMDDAPNELEIALAFDGQRFLVHCAPEKSS